VEPWSVDAYNALLVFTLLNLLDIATTYNILSRYGVEHEANWFARWIFKRMGIAGAFALKYAGMLAIVLASFFTTNDFTAGIWIDNIILSAVVAWNSYVNYKYRDRVSG
jgi:hypothetical protein